MRGDGEADRRLTVEIGVYTFAELRGDPASGAAISPEQRLRDLLEEIELVDEVGLGVFGVGEHHRTEVAPVVRKEVARRPGPPAPASVKSSQT